MLSQRQYHELMNSYTHVAEIVESATSFLDEDSRTVVSAGGACRQRSANLIHDMERMCMELRRWIAFFEENAEVE
ncbi:hypothetical protein [Saccharopolyspora phatthalungensis]|uniref:Uncharacterized protein n=1 Tax=Saccharopolyspora phatthalungensis TaxID=664693 RepID=A0A840Q5N4_9PSEU|nr:hypothetical protein [Saccharopolyspora phatthalungensis]MBB5154038.1 hypothetical protein [Saccharopolyspora phatthalungensis]